MALFQFFGSFYFILYFTKQDKLLELESVTIFGFICPNNQKFPGLVPGTYILLSSHYFGPRLATSLNIPAPYNLQVM